MSGKLTPTSSGKGETTKREASSNLLMFAAFLLSFLVVNAACQNVRASDQIRAPDEVSERERNRTQHTRAVIGDLKSKYNVVLWDDAIAHIIKSRSSDVYPTKEEKDSYFRFLHESILAYDSYAGEMFACWKQRRCHPSTMMDQCPFLYSTINELTQIDKLASRDPMKREVDDLLGEDKHQDYVSIRMPNLALYLKYVCKDYRSSRRAG